MTNRKNLTSRWSGNRQNTTAAQQSAITLFEHKTVKTEWSTAVKVTVKKTEYSFQVETSETYTVRTRAVNSMGVGQPAVVTVKFTAKDEKTLARSNKSRSSTTYCGSLGVLLLMLAMSRALA
ncbi:hypothetical protein OS493_015201 [Desmophyllum pertusum]|uniref:Uncharacterized protein n=1 Tax=Desmophyllum pertusum TaxID=174260 RepID=A0A9W9ZTC6_9CNID|nr:hypothetical protein OS493_015201 [Desmophyllum pertusum]